MWLYNLLAICKWITFGLFMVRTLLGEKKSGKGQRRETKKNMGPWFGPCRETKEWLVSPCVGPDRRQKSDTRLCRPETKGWCHGLTGDKGVMPLWLILFFSSLFIILFIFLSYLLFIIYCLCFYFFIYYLFLLLSYSLSHALSHFLLLFTSLSPSIYLSITLSLFSISYTIMMLMTFV
eukprot:Rmarinus@m.19353